MGVMLNLLLETCGSHAISNHNITCKCCYISLLKWVALPSITHISCMWKDVAKHDGRFPFLFPLELCSTMLQICEELKISLLYLNSQENKEEQREIHDQAIRLKNICMLTLKKIGNKWFQC